MKKRDGKKITINIHFTNRWLYTFIAIVILAAVGVGIYAATYSASGAGHPYTEISTCAANQSLRMNSPGTSWSCVNEKNTGSVVYRLHDACNDDVFRGTVYALVLMPDCFVETWVNLTQNYGCTHITFTQSKRDTYCSGTTPACGTQFNYYLYRCPNTRVGYILTYP